MVTKPTPDQWGNKKPLPIPDDLKDEFKRGSGPCRASSTYAVLATNQLGELQLHPCGFCGVVFVYSETYGWLWVPKDSDLRVRIRQTIDEAKAEGAFPAKVKYL